MTKDPEQTGTPAVAAQRAVSWRLLKSGGVAHAVQEPRCHQTMWTAVCGIGGHDGGESNGDKCKNCIRKLRPAVGRLTNENYIGSDGKWTRDNAPFTTFPCQAQEALDLAVQIQEKLRADWHGVSGIKDGVNLGLAARVLEAYHDIHKPRNTERLKPART